MYILVVHTTNSNLSTQNPTYPQSYPHTYTHYNQLLYDETSQNSNEYAPHKL